MQANEGRGPHDRSCPAQSHCLAPCRQAPTEDAAGQRQHLRSTVGAGLAVYNPVVCFVLQGSKQVFIGDQVLEYGAGHCMVVAAELAAMGQISEASPEEPYVALNLYIDPEVISALLLEMGSMPEPPMNKGFGFSPAGPALIDAWRRLVELLDRQDEIPIMARHREHELMFRLLMGPQGALLRQIAGNGSRLSHVRRAMAWIREHYTEHLSIAAMATVAGMSVSVFHRRFKAISGLSPLQYQKQIRLHEARRRLIAERSEAASVAYAVGYESVSQFSREYKRLFGAPPRQDAGKLQNIVESVA
ncbi:transcriptional regulator, AraC family [Rhizobium freirei PRF 81]|uniref:Transcriptional regulator, AraC family n=2 Tax=Rhizobium TaxID=379 RepID=N6V350_9HYPH|nr:transcriptional regulator, AraC family [Rhizobium tropici CIAT 899]ENN88325.1 transcriptional regulator, AraC family [Rhizobium freirei PRF 81]NEV15215.1 AraC family transcriptional regulator [Rhizobium tropici]TGE92749.1 AraC family transcriptional regulator [Rhizobium sp. SEMIA 4088]